MCLGYRRITFEVDERHVIARKFFQRCGFLHEATLRKHRIIQIRNSNTAVYVMLNSDWGSIESQLCRSVGLKPPDAKIKVAALPTTIDKSALVSSSLIMAGGDKKKNKKKRNKNKSSMIE
ncbi:N-acetyltransferase [archaeon]|nr:MAG: N-acetyltransferase [archaeon]